MNHYPIAMNFSNDTAGLSLEKIKPMFTTPAGLAIVTGAAGVGAMIGGEKNRLLGAGIAVAAVIGLLNVGAGG